jgi:polysaccharide deacetylase family protein (PEP-CTERM system associated)
MRILTFDIEDWFHIIQKYPNDILKSWDNYEVRIHNGMDMIFKILDDNNIKATFFILGYIARKHPEIVKRIHELGYEVAVHSDMHKAAYRQKRLDYKQDLTLAIDSLESLTGEKVLSYRAPGFSIKEYNVWAFEVLCELGIEYDASIFPARRDHGGFDDFSESRPSIIKYNGIKIKEFPMSVNSIFGKKFAVTGGGYFRFFPYAFMKKMVQNEDYTMTYFHPRDFDYNQPVMDGLSLARKFKSYYNLSRSYIKLKKMVTDFNFIDLRQASSNIDWNKVPIVDLSYYSDNK